MLNAYLLRTREGKLIKPLIGLILNIYNYPREEMKENNI